MHVCIISFKQVSSLFLQVTACVSTYFELRPCRPRLEKLKQLLAECPYKGPEYEGIGEEEEGGDEGEGEREGIPPKKRKVPKKVCT